MAKDERLAPAKDWRNRPIESWNVASFTEYLKDKHVELFGIDYAPHGGRWGMEQGVLGDLIGTQSRNNPKTRTASNEDVKEFIDICFSTYKPTQKYPGTSFGFCYIYRKNIWQQVQSRSRINSSIKQKGEEVNWEEISEWL